MTTAKPVGGNRVDQKQATRWRQNGLVCDFPGKYHLNDCLFVSDGRESAKSSL